MGTFTRTELRRILETSSGEAEGADWDDDTILDTPFDQIGYDSLAVIEMAAHVSHEYGLRIPDDDVADLRTPRIAIDYVSSRLAEV